MAFLAAVTLLPAIIVLTGRRGWIKPRRELTTRFWRRSGIRIVRRPRANLVASLIVLLLLAGCLGVVRYNYDDRKALPDSVESSIGYAAMDRHFPLNSTDSPVPVDPITTRLADTGSARRHGTDGTAGKPTARYRGGPGDHSAQRSTAGSRQHDASGRRIGKRLDDASVLIRDRTADLDRLASGSDQLADGLSTLRDQINQAMSGVAQPDQRSSVHPEPIWREQTFGHMGDADQPHRRHAFARRHAQATFGNIGQQPRAGSTPW